MRPIHFNPNILPSKAPCGVRLASFTIQSTKTEGGVTCIRCLRWFRVADALCAEDERRAEGR